MKAAQPKVYAKGPDVMSKSKWTQEQYWRQNWDQSSLTASRFTANWAEIKSKVSNQPSILLNEPSDSTHSIVELLSPQIPGFSHAQSASVLSNPSSDDQWNDLLFKEAAEGGKVVREVGDLEDDSEEEYESELEEAIQGPKNVVWDWSDLQKKSRFFLRSTKMTYHFCKSTST